MRLRYLPNSFGLGAESDRLEAAIAKVLPDGLRTKDIAAAGEATVSTSEMGDAIVAALRG